MIEGSYFKYFLLFTLVFFLHTVILRIHVYAKKKKRELSCDTEVCVRMSGTVYLILSTIWV